MSVEGMWKFQSGSLPNPTLLQWGGVVVLESGKVFGGDSVMAYLGTYEVKNGTITAKVRSWSWNYDVRDVQNVFGMEGPIDHRVTLHGQVKGEVIEGWLADDGYPMVKLAARLEKMAELP